MLKKIRNVTFIHACFLYISHGSLLNNVPHEKPLDSLVLLIKKNYCRSEMKKKIAQIHIDCVNKYKQTLGQHFPQLEQRMKLTWPRPCLLRPPFLRLNVCNGIRREVKKKNQNDRHTKEQLIKEEGERIEQTMMDKTERGGKRSSSLVYYLPTANDKFRE